MDEDKNTTEELDKETELGSEETKEEKEEDKTSEKNDEDKGQVEKDSDKDKPPKSAFIKMRRENRDLKRDLNDLKTQLSEKIQAKENISEDDAEKKAQAYIDSRIENILASREKAKKMEEEKNLAKFEEDIDEVLEENIEFTEKQILDLCEEMEVTPKVAARILKKQQESLKKKPSMPSPKLASSETKIKEEEHKPSGNFWDVTDKLLKRIKKGDL